MPYPDRRRLDRIGEHLPDAHGYMPRPPRDLAKLGSWAERGYGSHCPPGSIWHGLADVATKGNRPCRHSIDDLTT
jgi:hypothetical protein